MDYSNLEEKRVLVVDENQEIFDSIKEETQKIGLNCRFDKAASFSLAVDLIFSGGYDVVILYFPGIRGPYLSNLAFMRGIPVVLIASLTLFPLEVHHLIEKGIKEIIPKDKLREIGPILGKLLS
ncbi:MAG: hypothetical protein A2Y79_12965 [Deltaproteobacteria bacterium RBG_13_43_22]|nr:MAG: hypothetical protein A2Y79_12965 [Deltaproteobacteria bacterium RBG_13_43_22]